MQKIINQYQNTIEKQKRSHEEILLTKLQERKNKKSALLNLMNEKVDAAIHEVKIQIDTCQSDRKQIELENLLRELNEFKIGIKKAELNLATHKDKNIFFFYNFPNSIEILH